MWKSAQTAVVWLFIVSLTITLSATMPVNAQDSLFERLGGMEAIEAVVAESFNNWVNDERISHFFTSLSQDRADQVAELLVEQICEATGGPCTYIGLPMDEAHMGLGITDADFDALVEGMGAAMTTLGVPEAEQSEVVALLSPMRDEIVESMPEEPGGMPETGGANSASSMWPILITMVMAVFLLGWLDRKRKVTG